MPRDPRLWMPFPNDFWMHPKIAPLSDAAFRVFVEINGYSRMQDLDGRIPVTYAKKHWRLRAISELLKNHPERPSLSIDGDEYVIWNYSEHQETRETRAARQEISRVNGSKGGRPPGSNPNKTQPVTDPGAQKEPGENQSQSQSQSSEIEDRTDIAHPSSVPPVLKAPETNDEDREFIKSEAQKAGIKNLPRVLRAIRPILPDVTDAQAIDITRAITDLATDHVKSVEAYIESACRNSPDQIREVA